MIRFIFIIYWVWHLIWLYRFFYVLPLGFSDANLFTVEGYSNWSFICLIPSIVFIWREKSHTNDYKWWKLCMVSAVLRTLFSISALAGYRYYFTGFILTIFAIMVLILIDKSFKKNSDSIHII